MYTLYSKADVNGICKILFWRRYKCLVCLYVDIIRCVHFCSVLCYFFSAIIIENRQYSLRMRCLNKISYYICWALNPLLRKMIIKKCSEKSSTIKCWPVERKNGRITPHFFAIIPQMVQLNDFFRGGTRLMSCGKIFSFLSWIYLSLQTWVEVIIWTNLIYIDIFSFNMH